jgi:hypothetical protein
MMKESRWLIFLFFVFLFDLIKAQAQEPGSDLVRALSSQA